MAAVAVAPGHQGMSQARNTTWHCWHGAGFGGMQNVGVTGSRRLVMRLQEKPARPGDVQQGQSSHRDVKRGHRVKL